MSLTVMNLMRRSLYATSKVSTHQRHLCTMAAKKHRTITNNSVKSKYFYFTFKNLLNAMWTSSLPPVR